MRIFKGRWFERFARKEGIQDDELKALVSQVLEVDQVEASLGGGVYKVRVAWPGEGKSGGYRVIVCFKSGFRTFFVYGFAKADRENLDQNEVREYKKLAKDYLNFTEETMQTALESGKFIEI